MIFPDYALEYIENKELCKEANLAKNLMIISLDEMLESAKRENNKTCLLKRILPVVGWDMSVLACCNYSYNKISDNFLQTSIDDIINIRNSCSLCLKCQKYSLHRYFNPGYYADYVNKLLTENSDERK